MIAYFRVQLKPCSCSFQRSSLITNNWLFSDYVPCNMSNDLNLCQIVTGRGMKFYLVVCVISSVVSSTSSTDLYIENYLTFV